MGEAKEIICSEPASSLIMEVILEIKRGSIEN